MSAFLGSLFASPGQLLYPTLYEQQSTPAAVAATSQRATAYLAMGDDSVDEDSLAKLTETQATV